MGCCTPHQFCFLWCDGNDWISTELDSTVWKGRAIGCFRIFGILTLFFEQKNRISLTRKMKVLFDWIHQFSAKNGEMELVFHWNRRLRPFRRNSTIILLHFSVQKGGVSLNRISLTSLRTPEIAVFWSRLSDTQKRSWNSSFRWISPCFGLVGGGLKIRGAAFRRQLNLYFLYLCRIGFANSYKSKGEAAKCYR